MAVVPSGMTASRWLAAWASQHANSRGRLVPEASCPMRTPFQRDRDRIVHATAFRRLNYKTQVFLYHEGDHYRSRLTHSLEVAQIARAIARQLQLDDDLTEALALAHDLGHPPFGHAGERAMARVMQAFGGFDHNAQSLRVVTVLERKYAQFDGLNLTFETLDGLVKHNGPVTGSLRHGESENANLIGAVREVGLTEQLALSDFGSAEAQVAAIADDIAWHNHDIDDGLRAGLILLEDLADAPLAQRFHTAARAAGDGRDDQRLIYEINRRMITAMVADCVGETRARVERLAPTTSADIGRWDKPVVAFSATLATELAGLKAFLFERVYRHPRVVRDMDAAEAVVVDLFRRYLADPASLPPARKAALDGQDVAARVVQIKDFIAGMTDRFAIAEHRRLFDATPDLG